MICTVLNNYKLKQEIETEKHKQQYYSQDL